MTTYLKHVSVSADKSERENKSFGAGVSLIIQIESAVRSPIP